MKRDQFTWYRSYYEALRTLPAKDFQIAVLAICAYALDEEVPDLSGVPNSVFTLIRPTLDSGRNKAANRLKKQKTNQEQTDNKPEQTRKEKEGEGEREEESEREGENDMLKILPPGGGNTKSPAAKSRQGSGNYGLEGLMFRRRNSRLHGRLIPRCRAQTG